MLRFVEVFNLRRHCTKFLKKFSYWQYVENVIFAQHVLLRWVNYGEIRIKEIMQLEIKENELSFYIPPSRMNSRPPVTKIQCSLVLI